MGQTYGAKVRCRGVIVHDEQVLIVQQKGVTCLPGGTLEEGETPAETIAREMEEELGIVPDVGRVLVVLTFDINPKRRRIEFIYEIKNGADYRNQDKRVDASHGFELDEIVRRPIENLGDDFLPRVLVDMKSLMGSEGILYDEIDK